MITALIAAASLQTSYNWNYSIAPGPLDNPLKGWCPFVGVGSQFDQPYSMVYFNVKWRDLEPKPGEYKLEEWERKFWDLPAAKGRHIVFRVNVDYPTETTGVPQWLLDQGLKMTPYTDHGGGKSPDYTDPRFQRAMLSFIKALGQRYDNNPRVAFIQVGLLGFWGEWHTWPKTEMFAPEKFQREVLDGMLKAFPHTKLMARNPSTTAGKYTTLGFHDDMIPQDTLGPEEWKFLPGILANNLGGNWKQYPRGGEMVPGAANQYMGKEYGTTVRAVNDVHFSWIGPYCPALQKSPSQEYRDNCEALVRRMGYQFSLKDASVEFDGQQGALVLNGFNDGAAPFYYPWKLKAALVRPDGTVTNEQDTDVDIRTWQPGKFHVETHFALNAPTGTYRLAIGIIDPYTSKPRIDFASKLDHVQGWQVLGQVRVH